jgi:hypothetical protein
MSECGIPPSKTSGQAEHNDLRSTAMWLLPSLEDSAAGQRVLSGRDIWLRPRVTYAWQRFELVVGRLEEGEGRAGF